MSEGEENTAFDLYDDDIGKVQLVQHYGDDTMVVNSARVSFGQHREELSEKDKKLINYLIKNRHTSTLEHCGATFKFVVPLFVRSQHHRHRTWSYNEISRRYTDENLQFYEPDAFRTQHKTNRQASNENELINPELEQYFYLQASDKVKGHHSSSISLYNELITAGICREQARGILPQNLYTEYYGTANLSNLLKFIDLRLDSHAQWEIQRVAEAVLDILTELFPVTVESYRRIKAE